MEIDKVKRSWEVAHVNAMAKCDKRHRVIIRDAVPGQEYLVQGLSLTVVEKPKVKPTEFSKGKLVEDAETGLLMWDGDLGEDPGLAVLRNRQQD